MKGKSLVACFDEQNGENYRGLLIRGEGNALQVILGNNRTFMLPLCMVIPLRLLSPRTMNDILFI